MVFTSLIHAWSSVAKKSARTSPSASSALKARQASSRSLAASSGVVLAGASRAAPSSSRYLVAKS